MLRDFPKRFLLLWPLAGLLELPFLQFFLDPSPSFLQSHPVLSVVLHLFCSLVLAASFPKRGKESVWPRNFFFFSALLPVFGWFATGLFFLGILSGEFERSKLPETDEFTPSVDTMDSFKDSEKPVNPRQAVLKALDISPFADLLAGTDNALRRGAVERLAELKTPDAIGLLNQYRTDPSPEIRFFITSALTRLKKEWDEELESAKRQMQKDIYKISARIFLAKTYLQYARSGLLDAAIARAYEQEALYHLKFSIQSEHANQEAFWLLIDIHKGRSEWSEALDLIGHMERLQKIPVSDAIRSRIEIHHESGDFVRIPALLSRLKQSGFQDATWTPVISWWIS